MKFFPYCSHEYDLADLKHDEERGHNEILNRTDFDDDNLIRARLSTTDSILKSTSSRPGVMDGVADLTSLLNSGSGARTYPMMLKFIRDSIPEGNLRYTEDDINDDISISTRASIPSMSSIAKLVEETDGTVLDKKQMIAYESICATFLLGLINDGQDQTTTLGQYFREAANYDDIDGDVDDITNQLEILNLHLAALGGKDQLIMFLTGPAGAGKTTSVKVAERFCFEFCKAVCIVWQDNRFLFTAYTGSAASFFGGVTICKAAYLNKKKAIDDNEILRWQGVRILIIDEISFMKSTEMRRLDENLQIIGDSTKPFGGFSIIFSGDFRQLEPPGAKPNELLFSRDASIDWEEKLNAVVILENKHRFKDDPRYGRVLKKMWEDDINIKDRRWINERVVGRNNVILPKENEFGDKNVSYASPYNKERNAISAGNFKDHLLRTHPLIDDVHNPPSHTVIVEADMISAATKNERHFGRKIGGIIRHRILTTCGDAYVMAGTKHVDPALCLYVGAHLICTIGNENLDKKVSRGNGTACRVVGMKLKDNQTTYQWKNYYGRKVWTVSATDVEWIECEHYPKSDAVKDIEQKLKNENIRMTNFKKGFNMDESSTDAVYEDIVHGIALLEDALDRELAKHRFKLKPQQDSVTVELKIHPMAQDTETRRCKMTQLPVNSNDSTTGHKLQGMSKDVVIVTSWPSGGLFKNWEYVVLSRVRTHEGLFLFRPLSMDKSFKPSQELSLFFQRAREKQKTFLCERKRLQKQLKKRIQTKS